MKAVVEIAATEIDGPMAVELPEPLLCGYGGEVEEGVFVVELFKDLFFVEVVVGIDRYEVLLSFGDLLQTVHPVDGAGLKDAVLFADAIVPTAPGFAGSGHHRAVRMEDGFVALVLEGTKQLLFFAGGVVEQGQRLIGMAGEDHAIEMVALAIGGDDGYGRRVGIADDADDLVIPTDAIAEGGDEQFAIGLAAPVERPPLMLGIEAEETMVVEEADQGHGGEVEHFVHGGGPDGRAHGDKVFPEHIVAIACFADIPAQGVVGILRVVEDTRAFGVEATDLPEHADEGGAKAVAALGEKVVKAGAAVFEAGRPMLNAEGHVGFFHRGLYGIEQPAEVGVGFVVEDHKAGVDIYWSARFVDGHRVGMAADIIILFEEGERVMAMQKMATAHAGDTGPDDGGVHAFEAVLCSR